MDLFSKLERPISEIIGLRKAYTACGLATAAILLVQAIADTRLNILTGVYPWLTVWSLLWSVGPMALLLWVAHRRFPGFQMVVLVSSILQGAFSPGVWVWLTHDIPHGEGAMGLEYLQVIAFLISMGTWVLFGVSCYWHRMKPTL